MTLRDLHTLFLDQLDDLYAIERLNLFQLAQLEDNAQDPRLCRTLRKARADTVEQKRRIEAVFSYLGLNPSETSCPTFERLLQDALFLPTKYGKTSVHDAALIACLQRAVRFEIAIYGTAIELGKELGYSNANDYLKDTVREKCELESELSRIAVGGYFSKGLNKRAYAESAVGKAA